MITLDKIKLIASPKNIKILDKTRFEVRKGHSHDDISFTMTRPYNVYVEVDYLENELVLEFTGKVLLDDYPKLINKDTIRSCIENINKIGVCILDVEAIIKEGDVCKIDVTQDVSCEDCKQLTQDIRACVHNYNRHLPSIKGGNFVIEKNVKTPSYKKRLTIYDKQQEMNLAASRSFLNAVKDPFKLVDYFNGKVRFELNLNSQEQIRKSLKITDTSLISVLESTSSPISDFLLGEVLDPPTSDCDKADDMKDYLHGLVLQDNDYDLAKVFNKIKLYKPKARVRDLLPYKQYLEREGPKRKTLREKLQLILLLEMLLPFLPIVMF